MIFSEFSKNYKAELDLSDADELILKRSEKADNGISHSTYQHFVSGVKVEFSELLVHSDKSGKYAELSNDKLVKKLSKQNVQLTEPAALQTALTFAGNRKFAWLDPTSEREIKEETKNSSATNFPKGELLYARAKFKNKDAKDYRLCYRFEVKAVEPFYAKAIYIDAISGSVFKETDLIINCNDPATATTLYNGNQTISTDWKGWPWSRFILIDCGRNIHTKYGSGWNPEAESNSTTWGTNHQSATSGHWAAQITWDLYQNVYGRNGCNGAGREIKILVDFENYFGDPLLNNAYYELSGGSNDKIRVGRTSDGNRSLASLDIIGHEITHGLTRATANLVSENESGALMNRSQIFLELW